MCYDLKEKEEEITNEHNVVTQKTAGRLQELNVAVAGADFSR